MFSKIFGTDWKSPERYVILGASLFAIIFGLLCVLFVRTAESIQKPDQDSPLTIALSQEILQAAFDNDKQKRLLSAEFKVFDGEKAQRDKNYTVGHRSFADAVDELSELLGSGSQLTRIVMLRAGKFEYHFRKWKTAEQYFEKSIQEPLNHGVPKSFPIMARRWLARCLEQEGNVNGAIACHKKIVELAKNLSTDDKTTLITALDGLGNSYDNRNPAALDSYNQAISLIEKEKRSHRNDERDSSVYISRGYCNFDLQKNAEALADLNAGISLDENDSTAKAYRGCVLSRLGRNQEALTDFNRVLIEKDPPAWIFYRRGLALSAVGEHQKAIDDFATAAKLSKDDDSIARPVNKAKPAEKTLLQESTEAQKREQEALNRG